MIRYFRNYFVTGLLFVLPLILTVAIFLFLVEKVNSIFLEPIVNILEKYTGQARLEWLAKSLIFLMLISLITMIGMLAKNIMAKRVFRFFEDIFIKLPFVDKVYTAIRDVRDSFFGKAKGMFDTVVLVEYPRKGIYSLGFVTKIAEGEISEKLNDKRLHTVFIPTVPNPTSGVLVFFKEDDCIKLDLSVEEGFKFVISAGMTLKK